MALSKDSGSASSTSASLARADREARPVLQAHQGRPVQARPVRQVRPGPRPPASQAARTAAPCDGQQHDRPACPISRNERGLNFSNFIPICYLSIGPGPASGSAGESPAIRQSSRNVIGHRTYHDFGGRETVKPGGKVTSSHDKSSCPAGLHCPETTKRTLRFLEASVRCIGTHGAPPTMLKQQLEHSWRWRESNPRPSVPHQGFSGRSLLCFSQPRRSRRQAADRLSRC